MLNAAKHCWPQSWSSLTPSLIAIARKSEGACGAVLEVFKRLAEDVYPAGVIDESVRSSPGSKSEDEDDGSEGAAESSGSTAPASTSVSAAVTSAAMRRLQVALRAETPRVLTLLKQVLDMAKSPDLVSTALSCLSVYVPLCPLPVLLGKKEGMIGVLLRRHLLQPLHRSQALACLSEFGRRRVGSWATDLNGSDKDDVTSGSDFLRCPDAMMRKAVAAGRGVRWPGKSGEPPGGLKKKARSHDPTGADSDSDDDMAAAEATSDDLIEGSSGYGVALTPSQAKEACSPTGIADGIGAALAAVVA